MTTAKRRAIDYFRHQSMSATKNEELARTLAALEQTTPDIVGRIDDPIGDDLLRLIFISCHPMLPRESRAAMTLRVVGGLTTGEIARSFLAVEPTIACSIAKEYFRVWCRNLQIFCPYRSLAAAPGTADWHRFFQRKELLHVCAEGLAKIARLPQR